ncbi:hypothetical protein WJ16_14910 [Burkholderia metallica]|nr:hypothetical protein WJ16_14910 [Burkholderia metallica]
MGNDERGGVRRQREIDRSSVSRCLIDVEAWMIRGCAARASSLLTTRLKTIRLKASRLSTPRWRRRDG